ncbi:MotA/TolQ/ExbB proton channel family protein [Marinisporobacter balticus]|uniref:MotA/TolQ/ExbB proton channel family protein n=1 Tax=Marinisporobacter balticus TaxID=2018667 RepID=UPI001404299A|nr:MotA/TolQ/ExbB proton channel family protein [Marinisporobacter balticus]
MFNVLGKLNPLAIVLIVAIIGVFMVGFVATVVIRKKYMNIREDLLDAQNRENSKYDYKVLNLIIEDYKRAAKGNQEVNTQAIIERNFNSELSRLNLGERFIKNAVSLMIILGLLGTFYGLTLSIGKLVEMLSASGNVDMLNSMESIVSGLMNSVKGMSVAFVTSLFGIAGSIIFTILNIIYDVETEREAVMIVLEEYLDNHVALAFSKEKKTEYELLDEALKGTFRELGGKMENSIKYVADGLGNQFTAATRDIGLSSKALLESVQLFDQSLKDFKENTRDFSEFNYQLRTNIERMNVGFADLTNDLKTYSKDLSKSYKTKE